MHVIKLCHHHHHHHYHHHHHHRRRRRRRRRHHHHHHHLTSLPALEANVFQTNFRRFLSLIRKIFVHRKNKTKKKEMKNLMKVRNSPPEKKITKIKNDFSCRRDVMRHVCTKVESEDARQTGACKVIQFFVTWFRVLLVLCFVGSMFCWFYALFVQCFVGSMLCLFYALLVQIFVGPMLCWLYGLVVLCFVGPMLCWVNALLVQCFVGSMQSCFFWNSNHVNVVDTCQDEQRREWWGLDEWIDEWIDEWVCEWIDE